MQAIKGLVSVKSRERRLPPLRASFSVDTQAVHLPSIRRSLGPDVPLPSIPNVESGASEDFTVDSHPSESPISVQLDSNAMEFSNNNQATDQGETIATVRETEFIHNPTLEVGRDATESECGALPAELFQTTTDSAPVDQTVRAAVIASVNANKTLTSWLERRGIRTWPVIAIISVFCCNPVTGMVAALLTLTAENSFYKGDVVQAQRESQIAKVFLIISLVSGCITIVAVIIWALYECTADGCPTLK